VTVTEVNVSIIVPTYNRGYMVGRAIQSILNQTYEDFEILIVDDTSTDNTSEIVQSISSKKIAYIRHERNKGPAATRNTGIMAAKGEYIAFLDSDDEWLPEKLEKQMKAFRNASPQVGIVYTGLIQVEGNNKTYIPPPYTANREGNIHYSLFVDPLIVYPSTAVIRRECLSKVGMFDECFHISEDRELWIRISKYYDIKLIDEPLVIHNFMPDHLTATKPASCTRGLEMILEKHFEDIRKDRRTLARFYVNLGASLCSEGKLSEGRGYFFKAAIANPLDIVSMLAYLASLTGQNGYDKAVISYKKMHERGVTKKHGSILSLQ